MYFKVILVLFLVKQIVLCDDIKIENNTAVEDNTPHHRKARFLLFPRNVCFGILFALAIPLDLPHRSVFFSYNFEANYNGPTEAGDLSYNLLNRLELDRSSGRNGDINVNDANSDNNANKTKTNESLENETLSREIRSPSAYILSRRKTYKTLEMKFEAEGFNGRACLLRLICETNKYHLAEHNGVLGDIFHIIFSPSASKPEKIHSRYYEAEASGISGQCKQYHKKCPRSILDFISQYH